MDRPQRPVRHGRSFLRYPRDTLLCARPRRLHDGITSEDVGSAELRTGICNSTMPAIDTQCQHGDVDSAGSYDPNEER